MTFLDTIRAAFSAETRQKVYATAGVLITALVTFGVLGEEAGNQILLTVAAVLAFVVAALQLVNFQIDSLASWFSNFGRAAIYALAGTVLPALVFFGIIEQDASSAALAALSSALALISSLVGIYFAPAPFSPKARHVL